MGKLRVGIFVDGANILKSLNHKRFHYNDLNEWIAKGRKVTELCYFDSVMESNKDKQKFINHLKLCGYKVFIKKVTKILKTKKFKQTGVDVLLSLKALKYADNYDVFVLVSGDYDYIPLLEELKQMGKQIEVVSFKECMHPIYRDKFKSRYMDEFIEELPYVKE